MSSAVRRPARTAPAAFHSSWNCPTGPSASAHLCSRSPSSPPRKSSESAMYPAPRGRCFGVRCPVLVGEAIGELERSGRVDRRHPPPAARPLAPWAGHDEGHLTAGRHVVLLHGRRVGRRAPPALELPWVGPQLPHPLDRGIELGDQEQAHAVHVLLDADDGHSPCPVVGVLFSGSARRSAIRSTRPRQVASSSSRTRRARLTAA